jgi:hypothetical protein
MGAGKWFCMTTTDSTPKVRLRWYIALLINMLILGILFYSLLRIVDSVMVQTMPGYRSNHSFAAPSAIFFSVVLYINYHSILYGWQRVLSYVLSGISMFFPLIFLLCISRFYLGLPEELALFYQQEYCPISTDVYCGQALAHMVFCSTIRTLPLLVIMPTTFYGLLKINFFGVAKPYGMVQ